MKLKHFFLSIIISLFFIGCSKEADDAYSSSGFTATDINGTWKESTTGVIYRISGVTSTANGKGVVVNVGTAYPSGAVGGTAMTDVEHKNGGYWDAYNNTYFPSGSWVQGSAFGMSMTTTRNEFKIGSKVYKRQ